MKVINWKIIFNLFGTYYPSVSIVAFDTENNVSRPCVKALLHEQLAIQ